MKADRRRAPVFYCAGRGREVCWSLRQSNGWSSNKTKFPAPLRIIIISNQINPNENYERQIDLAEAACKIEGQEKAEVRVDQERELETAGASEKENPDQFR